MKSISTYLGIGMLIMFTTQFTYAQSKLTRLSNLNIPSLRTSLESNNPKSSKLLPSAKYVLLAPKLLPEGSGASMKKPLAAAPIPPAWRYQDLAFFCKLEVKMEKTFKMPVKFRLGEVQYVEKMEGKLK